jgi:uncharacterized protein (TIGR03435 family)
MRCLATATLFLAGSALFAQNPTFEVASIKATAPQEMGRVMVRMGGDPGRIDWVNVSLRDVIRTAYGVKDYQVSGPDWMTSARFDIQAKYPPDTPIETRNLMLQALLAERFGLKVHKESKETQTYSLVVGKNGHKLKKADPNKMTTMMLDGPGGPGIANRNVQTGPGGPSGSATAAAGGAATGGASVGGGRAGAPAGGPGGPGGGRGMTMMRMEGPGKLHMTSMGTTLPNLAEMLARQVGKPVFDETKLEGPFDIDLEFKPEAGMGGMIRMAGPGMPHGDGSGPAPDAVEAPSIFTAVQDQLGLKLESKKGPIETIVVDSANKTPTEN